jgi:Sec-independent protein translocase protein TatA
VCKSGWLRRIKKEIKEDEQEERRQEEKGNKMTDKNEEERNTRKPHYCFNVTSQVDFLENIAL